MFKRVMFVVFVAALLPLAVYAQEGEDVALSGGYQITLPDGWTIEETDDGYTLTNGERQITLMLPEAVTEQVELVRMMDATEVLLTLKVGVDPAEALFGAATGSDEEYEIEEYDVDGRQAATLEFEGEDGVSLGLSAVLEVAPKEFAWMEFLAPAEDYPDALDEAQAIMLSLRLAGEDAAPSAAGGPVEPCTVRAKTNAVDLHVGPGANRGVYTTMPTGLDIPVMGQKTMDDGSLWWRLDMDTGAANELWVADADVEQKGGCAQVQDVDAPPVIMAPPPAADTAPPAADGAPPADNAPTGDTGPAASPSLVPATGTWYVTMSGELLLSCQGGNTIHVPNEVSLATVIWLSASSDGSVVTLREPGATMYFVRTGPGTYVDDEFSEPGFYMAFRIYVNDPTHIRGELVVASLDQPCSGTIHVGLQYQG